MNALGVKRTGACLVRAVLDFVLNSILKAQDLLADRVVIQSICTQPRNNSGYARTPVGVGLRAVNLIEFIGD